MKIGISNTNRIFLKEIENLINNNFKEPGDCIGDYLMLMELDNAKVSYNLNPIQYLIDKHAQKGDEILSSHRTLLIENIKNFLKSVSEELK